jgi:cytochrome bd-type quinol oxidase subunit 2
MSAASVVRAAARAMLAVLFSVAIWVWVYGLSESVFSQFPLFLALPIVVFATLLYVAFGRWRRHVDGGSEPPPLRWKVAGAVLALVLASAGWAGVYAYAASVSYNEPLYFPFLILGVPPVLGMAILIYTALSAASRR